MSCSTGCHRKLNWSPFCGNGISPFEQFALMMDIFEPNERSMGRRGLRQPISRSKSWTKQHRSVSPETRSPLHRSSSSGGKVSSVLTNLPQKYRITINCRTVDRRSIKTAIKKVGNQYNLVVCGQSRDITNSGRGEGRVGTTPNVQKEFKRSYTLPAHIKRENMTTWVSPAGAYVVEFPFIEKTPASLDIELKPRKVKSEEGDIVMLKVPFPDFVDPAKVQVSHKGCNLVLRFEERKTTCDGISRVFYYNEAKLPNGTDVKNLNCKQDKHRLTITAPFQKGILSGFRCLTIDRKLRHKKTQKGIQGQEQKQQTKVRSQSPSIAQQQGKQKKQLGTQNVAAGRDKQLKLEKNKPQITSSTVTKKSSSGNLNLKDQKQYPKLGKQTSKGSEILQQVFGGEAKIGQQQPQQRSGSGGSPSGSPNRQQTQQH